MLNLRCDQDEDTGILLYLHVSIRGAYVSATVLERSSKGDMWADPNDLESRCISSYLNAVPGRSPRLECFLNYKPLVDHACTVSLLRERTACDH